MNKLIAIRITQEQDPTLARLEPNERQEVREYASYWSGMTTLVTTLFDHISTPQAFLQTLDSILIHAKKEPALTQTTLIFAREENETRTNLESLARVFLETSLAKQSHSLQDMPLWKIVLGMKVQLQGIRLSGSILKQTLGDVPVITNASASSDSSRQLRSLIQAKAPFGKNAAERARDTLVWQACLSQLDQLDVLYPSIPAQHKPDFDVRLNALTAMIGNNHCSVGTKGSLEDILATVIGWLDNPDWPTLANSHSRLMVNASAQRILLRIGVVPLEGGALDVHDAQEVIRAFALSRGVENVPQDPYLPANREVIKTYITQNQIHFDDPLEIADLINEILILPGSPTNILETTHHLEVPFSILEKNPDNSILTRLRGPMCEWLVTHFASQPEKLLEQIKLFEVNPADTYGDLMPAKILFLRTTARLGHPTAFEAILNDETIPMDTIRWTEPISGDPDQRNWIHVALLGGSQPILEIIWNGMMLGKPITDLDLQTTATRPLNRSSFPHQLFWQSEPHSLLHHAADSPDDTALTFLLEKLPDRLAEAHHPEISDWIQHRTNDGYTPLLRAAFSGNASGVRCLLDVYTRFSVVSNPSTSTGIFSRSTQDQSILHCAAHSQKPEIADMLLTHPAFLGLTQTQKENFILLPTSSRLSSLQMASFNSDIHLLTSLLTVLLQEKTFNQKLQILAPFLHHPLDLTTLLPELSSQKVINLIGIPIGPKLLIKLMQMATSCLDWNLSGLDLSSLTIEQVQRFIPDALSVKNINLYRAKIKPDVHIALLAKLKCESWDLTGVYLSDLTVEQIPSLIPDGLSVKDIKLFKAQIKPDVLIALLAKLKSEIWDLRGLDLSGLTMEQVQSLIPDGLSVESINLFQDQITPDIRIALLTKLKCETWDLCSVDLSDLTVEQVQRLIPDGLSVNYINLSGAWIKPDVHIALLAKLKCETWDLKYVDLSSFTPEQVQNLIPDGLSVKRINLYGARIKPEVHIALLAKLNCKTWDLSEIDLRGLTMDQVQNLIPDGLSVKNINLLRAQIKLDVLISLLAKLKCATWDLWDVDLSGLTMDQIQNFISVKRVNLSGAQIKPDVRIALLDKLKCESWDLSKIDLRGLKMNQIQSLNPDGLSVKIINLSETHIKPKVRIALLAKLKCDTWDLSKIDLRDLTMKHVQRLNPDGLSVRSINLSGAKINPDTLVALLAKLKCETWNLSKIDLRDLKMKYVQRLNPDGLSVRSLNLSGAKISPDVLVALIAKFKCEEWDFQYVDLRGLTVEHVQRLNPDGLSIKSINLCATHIKENVRIALLARLNNKV